VSDHERVMRERREKRAKHERRLSELGGQNFIQLAPQPSSPFLPLSNTPLISDVIHHCFSLTKKSVLADIKAETAKMKSEALENGGKGGME